MAHRGFAPILIVLFVGGLIISLFGSYAYFRVLGVKREPKETIASPMPSPTVSSSSSPTSTPEPDQSASPLPSSGFTPSPRVQATSTPIPSPTVIQQPLIVIGVNPLILPLNYQEKGQTKLTILGMGFREGAQVGFQSGPNAFYYLQNTTVRSSSQIEGTLPGNLASGYYLVQVKNPDGESYTLNNGLLISTQNQ